MMMNIESSIAVKYHKEKTNSLFEVFDVERQLWKYVHSRGLLNADVHSLYRKACSLYENILLENNELDELQEIEYSLWKLHYKHIDEFRKQTSQSSAKEETEPCKNHENVLKGFKLFLRESSTFYQDLISKIKRLYDVPSQVDQATLRKCRFLCHHLLVRLGDLARYLEVHAKSGFQQKNWSVAAKHYLEASKMYPDGGNPHNQLAWLATYVGDEFLALYHCMRSLAVKEPFPDASNNIAVIFERNQSTHIDSISSEAQFDFLKPSERVMLPSKLQESDITLRNIEGGCSTETDFWALIVRVTSLFFLDYSYECLSYTFGSTIRALESLLAYDDATLSSALESYQNVNLSRSGPYKALQFVSVLIFTIQNLCKIPEHGSLKLQMAFAVMYIIMGRVLERCLKVISMDKNPLLPAVLVFSEWLVSVLDKVVKCEMEDKLASAMSYFFSFYIELLNRLADSEGEVRFSDHGMLWEDYEMMGYNPITLCHSSLDFSAHRNNETSFSSENEHRVHRILQAAIKLANDDSQRWILYDKGGRFCMKEAKLRSPEVEENQSLDSEPKESDQLGKCGVEVVVEEEEDIVFKPITRYNSAPLPASLTKQEEISQESNPKAPKPQASDESLRRASSLLIAQNRALIGAMTSAGPRPPSLSAWVLNDERIGKIGDSFLKPIDEIASDSVDDLSLDDQDERFGFVNSAGKASTSTALDSPPHNNYCPPTPSAPLLPEDATWLSPAMLVPTTPAPEWLLLRKENQNIHWSNNHNSGMQQHQYFAAAPWYGGNICIQSGWGYPVAPIQPMYTEHIPTLHQTTHFINGFYDQRRETMLFQHNSDHERAAPYICGNVMDVRADEHQLLQYLKEKELRIQHDAQNVRKLKLQKRIGVIPDLGAAVQGKRASVPYDSRGSVLRLCTNYTCSMNQVYWIA